MYRYLLLAFCLIMLPTTTPANADEQSDAPAKVSKAQQANAIFTKIKSLAGDWEHAAGPAKGQLALSVTVIAGGSAIVERQFPGSPMEMVTVYHLDGDEVMLNHYCMLGNQPRLKARMSDRKNTIKFDFVSATNLASKNDAHMHEGELTIVDKDTIKSTWTKFENAKPAGDHSFQMIRRK